MNRISFHISVVIGLFALVASTRAEPPRTLIPVSGSLEKLRGNLKQTRELSAKDQSKARKALHIAAPKISERLGNLAEVSKRLEAETNEIAESVAKQNMPKTDKAKELLSRQDKLNQKIEQMKEVLRRDGNAQDMKQEEGRERARDADDAVAMLDKPPLDAKNALEESVSNKAPKEQHASLESAVRNQNELTQALDQLAEHYENLENGEGEKTRASLREKEAELGIKERLDAEFAALEEVLELANMSPADQIKALEQKLKDNPVMQNELRDIAEDTVDNAKVELDELDNNQPPASDQDVKAAVEAAEKMAEQEVPKIQKDAQQAKAAAATEELKQARESLEAAAQKGAEAMKNPAMKPEEKMQAMGEELAAAAKALEQAAEKAGEKVQSANNPAEKAAAEKAQAAAKAAAQKAQQMVQQAQKGESSQQQAGNNQPPASGAGRTTDPVEAYMWAYVAREQARKAPGQKANAVRANIHLNRIKKELSRVEIEGAETKAKEILSKL